MTVTGYTVDIANGTCKTPRKFLESCLTRFGCCVDLRDSPVNCFNAKDFIEELKNKPLHEAERLAEIIKDFNKASSKPQQKWEEEFQQEKIALSIQLEQEKAKAKKESEQLSFFINSIKNWECSSQYQNIKSFALQQLEISKPTGTSYSEQRLRVLQNMSVEEFKNTKLEALKDLVKSYTEQLENADACRKEKVAFIEGFIKELERIPEGGK